MRIQEQGKREWVSDLAIKLLDQRINHWLFQGKDPLLVIRREPDVDGRQMDRPAR